MSSSRAKPEAPTVTTAQKAGPPPSTSAQSAAAPANKSAKAEVITDPTPTAQQAETSPRNEAPAQAAPTVDEGIDAAAAGASTAAQQDAATSQAAAEAGAERPSVPDTGMEARGGAEGIQGAAEDQGTHAAASPGESSAVSATPSEAANGGRTTDAASAAGTDAVARANEEKAAARGEDGGASASMGASGASAAEGSGAQAATAASSAQERSTDAAAGSTPEALADGGLKGDAVAGEGTGASQGSAVAAISAVEATGAKHDAAGATSADTAVAAQKQDTVVGLVDVPGKKATVKEDTVPQTLGGMLPMTLGVDGEGEFDFDKAVLRPEVKGVLDKLAAKLKESEYDTLNIVGHADRLGTEEYNQSLSERRAWAVARYLMSQGVPLQKIRVEGRGLHEPLSSPDDCAGLNRKEAIVCLQKDRRVEIAASIRKTDVKVQ